MVIKVEGLETYNLDKYKKMELEIVSEIKYVELKDNTLLSILKYNQKMMGLDDETIVLYKATPVIDIEGECDNLLGEVFKDNNSNKYGIALYMDNRPTDSDERYLSFVETIRHELTHIKNGDVDRKLPNWLSKLYNLFVGEPHARRGENYIPPF